MLCAQSSFADGRSRYFSASSNAPTACFPHTGRCTSDNTPALASAMHAAWRRSLHCLLPDWLAQVSSSPGLEQYEQRSGCCVGHVGRTAGSFARAALPLPAPLPLTGRPAEPEDVAECCIRAWVKGGGFPCVGERRRYQNGTAKGGGYQKGPKRKKFEGASKKKRKRKKLKGVTQKEKIGFLR